MALPIRLKTMLVLALLGASVYLGVANLVDRGDWRRVTDDIEWVEAQRGLEIDSVPIDLLHRHPGLLPGTLLIRVNEIPVGGLDDLTEVREFLAENLAPGTSAEYVFQASSGEEVAYPITLSVKSAFAAIDFFLVALAFGFLSVGFFILLRNWNAAGAFHFYLICLVAFIVFLFRYSGRADAFDVIIYVVDVLAFLALPPLFLHFCLKFPRRVSGVHGGLVYLPAAALSILFLLWLAGWMQPVGFPRTPAASQLQDTVHLLHFIVLFVVGALVLLQSGRFATTSISRQQMKWISGGAVAGLAPCIGLYAIPWLLHFPIHPWMESAVLSLFLIPLSFGYAITRYRLMDVDLIFKRTGAYLLASGLLVGSYVGLVIGVGRAIQSMSSDSGFVLFGLGALVVAFLFAPLNNRIQDQIDRYFYKDKFDYRQSFIEFSQTLNSEMDLPKLAEKITSRVHQTLDLGPVGLFLKDQSTGTTYRLFEVQGSLDSLAGVSIDVPDDVLAGLKSVRTLFPRADSAGVAESRRRLSEFGFHLVQPLSAHDRLIGFLALGKRTDDHLLNSEDLQLLETLAGYAAIAIDNAVLYRSLETNAAELAELKAYSDNVIESINLGVVVITPDGEITIWNSSMESVYGLPREQAVGKKISEVLPEKLIGTLQRFVKGPGWEIEETGLIRKTHLDSALGESLLVNVGIAPFVSTQNITTGTLLIFDDVTQRAQLESQLLQAERLSSIGLFAAGVAHEVNTPLAGISSYAQMLIKETTEEDPRRDLLKRIEQQSFRASRIVNNLLNFARVNESDFGEVNINSLMVETVSLLDHPLSKAGVKVDIDLDPGLPATFGSGGKLQQVFMNLFLNAKDAMPAGGDIHVKTFKKGSSLVVQIQDSGQGISEEHIKRIYDPFFTTKSVDKGTGLGLSVSYGIVQEHSGRISVDSRKGLGTTFTVELPLKRIN